MEPARETTKERGVGTTSVINVLLVIGAGGITIWGGDLDFVGNNVSGAGGNARGLPNKDDGVEGKAAEVRDLHKQGGGEGSQGSGNPDTGVVN